MLVDALIEIAAFLAAVIVIPALLLWMVGGEPDEQRTTGHLRGTKSPPRTIP